MILASAFLLFVGSLGAAILKATGRCRAGWGIVALPALVGVALVVAALGAFLTMLSTVATAFSQMM
jgi:hypothetical protein